jgi:hypothetical protein
VFSGFIPPDVTFFGFDIDKEQVAEWCFVLEEQMSEPRVRVRRPGDTAGPAAGNCAMQRRRAQVGAVQALSRRTARSPRVTTTPTRRCRGRTCRSRRGAFASVSQLDQRA